MKPIVAKYKNTHGFLVILFMGVLSLIGLTQAITGKHFSNKVNPQKK